MTTPIAQAGGKAFDVLGLDGTSGGSGEGAFDYVPNARANEDSSYFGPLGVLLLIPVALATLVLSIRRREQRVPLVLALSLPLYALALAMGTRYNAFLGRFMITPVALNAPLLAQLYRKRLLTISAAGLAVSTLFLAHAFNRTKPTGIDGSQAVWSLSRARAQGLGREGMGTAIAGLERAVPDSARVGFALSPGEWVYPLYGPPLRRTLTELRPAALAVGEGPRRVDAVVVGAGMRIPAGARDMCLLRFPASGWRIFVSRASRSGCRRG